MKLRLLSAVLFFACALHAQTYLGNFSRIVRDESTVTVQSDSSSVRVQFYTQDIVRLDFLPLPHSVPDSSFAVIENPVKDVQFTISETDSSLIIASSTVKIICKKYPLRFSFSDMTGNVLLEEPRSGGVSMNGDHRTVRFTLQPNDHFYGTGERGTSLDKRGQKFENWNTQIGGYSTPLPTMNLNVTLLTTSSGYALYCDNTYKGEFDLGATDPSIFSYTAFGGEMTYYVIAGKTIPEQLEKYTWLTGRQPLPPRWAFGFTQSKNRYRDEAEARSIVQTMREKKIPCDAIVLDLAWFKHMGDIAWNEQLWPNHDAMVNDFLKQGMKTILITEPYIIEPSLNFYEGDSLGYLAKDSLGRTFIFDKWWSCGYGCNSSLLDITNPKAREWWWSKHPAPFGSSVAGIWTDLGEPERHPENMFHHYGPTIKIHNIYNLLWAKTIFDGFTQIRPGERVVNLTRSGSAGAQRYGILPWSGDVARSFGGLAVQLPMVLNMGMSGISYHNSDIGGYSRIPTTPELYARWMEYGTFCPIARAHGAGESVNGSATEPWMFGEETERISREFISLRYRLLPYIYTMAHQNYTTGMPLVRPLFWLEPNNPKFANESSSYMWGDVFLVSPVVEAGQKTKQINFPSGRWINFWTDETVNGGKSITVAAPLGKMPLFVKEGSIIPMSPLMNYSDERPLDTVIVRVYPSAPKAHEPLAQKTKTVSYTLYEDDGKTLEYQKGNFAQTTFTQSYTMQKGSGTITLTSSASVGEFSGKLKERTYLYEVHGVVKKPGKIVNSTKEITSSKSLEVLRKKTEGYFFDAKKQILYVQLASKLDSGNEISVSGVVLK